MLCPGCGYNGEMHLLISFNAEIKASCRKIESDKLTYRLNSARLVMPCAPVLRKLLPSGQQVLNHLCP